MTLIFNSLMVYGVEHVTVLYYLYNVFWLGVCSDLYLLFIRLFKRVLSILCPNLVTDMNFSNIFLPVCGLYFDFLNEFFQNRHLYFYKVHSIFLLWTDSVCVKTQSS